jgi:hypothetical protein
MENFLVGGAGGFRRVALPMGVFDRDPGAGVREEADKFDAADPGRSVGSTALAWLRVKD